MFQILNWIEDDGDDKEVLFLKTFKILFAACFVVCELSQDDLWGE